VTELLAPIARGDVEFLAPRYRRHPRDGILITQLVRPLVRALYAVGLDEPLGAEFACSGRFASHCLEQDIWNHESARFAIDLWLRTEAAAERFPIGQIWRPVPTAAGGRTTLRDVVHQVVLAVIESLRAHESFWRNANAVSDLHTWGTEPAAIPELTLWDYQALAEQARRDIIEITPLLEDVLDPGLFVGIMENVNGTLRLDDELWVRTVYGFATAIQHGRAALDHMADMFVPLYMWRAAAFMSETSPQPHGVVQDRLDALCDTFQRLKPTLVAAWSNEE
jgi:hypothetical protein